MGELLKQLGAISMDASCVANFFEQPWTTLRSGLSTKASTAILDAAAEGLHSLVRLGLPTALASPAVAIWQRTLDMLLVEEAKSFDPAAKFKIQEDIEEIRQKLRELGGHGEQGRSSVR